MEIGTIVFCCKQSIRGFGEVLLESGDRVFVELSQSEGGWAVDGKLIEAEGHPLIGFDPGEVVSVEALTERPALVEFITCPIHGADCPNA